MLFAYSQARAARACLASILACAWHLAAVEAPVTVAVEEMRFQVRTAAYEATRNYPDKSTRKTEELAVEVVKLSNGLIETWVVPAWGARLLRTRDLKTGRDHYRWKDLLEGELGWGGVGMEASFPFFEHGIHLQQPAGYRIARLPDGSVTVAMDMRFTQHQHQRDAARYGRYSDEILSIMVTVEPGSSVVSWRQRKDNPNPTPRADRLWNCLVMPVDRVMKPGKVKKNNPDYVKGGSAPKKIEVDGLVCDRAATKELTKLIYPARYVVDHGPTTVHVSPHHSRPENWNVSHFGIDASHGFLGVYDLRQKTNYIRLNDPQEAPGAKLYSCWWADMCEYWGGYGYVFEHPGYLRPGHAPVEFTHRMFVAQDIGPMSYANEAVAVSVQGQDFELVASRRYDVAVSDDGAAVVARGEVGPHQVLRGSFDGQRLIVRTADATLMDQTFPLALPTPGEGAAVPDAQRAAFERLRQYQPSRPECEQVMNNRGLTTSLHAVEQAGKIDATSKAAKALSLARTCYRHGHLDEAKRIAGLFPGPEADFLLGLINWEDQGTADFGQAGWEADYMRALAAKQTGDQAKAIGLVTSYLVQVPTAWYPRLALAYWKQDLAAAKTLAVENPASPEAQTVLVLLGEQTAQAEVDQLLRDNPQAAEQLTLFRDQLVEGRWQHLPRYEPGLPVAEASTGNQAKP